MNTQCGLHKLVNAIRIRTLTNFNNYRPEITIGSMYDIQGLNNTFSTQYLIQSTNEHTSSDTSCVALFFSLIWFDAL